jgi:hypothetical protein
MPRSRTHQRSFVGGIVSPALWGHVEDPKYRTGGAVYLNMVPLPQGRLDFRPGTKFVYETSDSTKSSVVRPFGAGAETSYVVGIEEGAFRFYVDGAAVLWGTSRKVSAINAGTDIITFTKPHGLVSNQQIKLVRPGASTSPDGLDTTTTYYAIPLTSTTAQVSASTGPGAAVDIGPGTGSGDLYFFTVADLPANYVASKNISSIDLGSEELTVTAHGLASNGLAVEFTLSLTFTAAMSGTCTAASHGLSNSMPVRATSSGALPSGWPDQVLYVQVLTGNTFRLSVTPGGAQLTFGDTGSGTLTLHLEDGAAVFTATPAVEVGSTYYARVSNANEITLHPTAADAVAGSNTIQFTANGALGGSTATARFHRAYQQADLANFPNSGVYYCEIDNPQDSAPGGADWYLLPFTGEYEVPNNYVESNLPNITYRQKGDVMRLAHPDHGLYDLVRESNTVWTFTEVTFARPLNPPTGIEGEATFGVIVLMETWNPGSGFNEIRTPTATALDHGWADGDVVWLSANDDGTGAVGGVSAQAAVVERMSDTSVKLKGVEGGSLLTFSGAATSSRRCAPMARSRWCRPRSR